MKKSFYNRQLRFACLFGGLVAVLLSAVSVQAQRVGTVIHSTTPMINQRVVTRFSLANFERIRLNRTALSCQYMPECEPGGCSDCGGYGEPAYGEYVDETTIRGQGSCSACEPACEPACGPCMPSSFLGGIGYGGGGGGGLWYQNYGDFVTQQERNQTPGYSADSYGLSLGYDLWRNSQSVFGVGVGGAFSEAKTKKYSAQKVETDSFLLALYGAKSYCTWNLQASIGYVHSAFESQRDSTSETDVQLFGKHHGETIFGSFEISSNVMQNALGVSPFLAYDFIRMEENAWGENSAEETDPEDTLTVDKRHSKSYLQTLGLRFERSYYEANGWLVQPSLSFGWLHDYGQRRITTTGLVNENGFSYKGTFMNKNRFVTSLNVTASMGNRTSLFVRYDGEFNRHYNAQTFQFGFGLGY